MYHWQVSDVMTADVVTAAEDASIADIANKMGTHHVSGLPIVDDGHRPIGFVSQADLLPRIAATPPAARRALRSRRAAKATATSARQLMSTPLVTIGADEPLSAAARKMQFEGVKRLLVTDAAGQLLFDDSALASSRAHRTDPLSSEPRRLHLSRGSTS